FVTYPNLPAWPGPGWSLVLTPGWRELAGKPVAEIAARQWALANRQILADLAGLPPERRCAVSYEEFIANPQAVAEKLAAFAGLGWDRKLEGSQPLSKHTLTPPSPDKWRKHEAEIEPLL